MKSYWLLVVCTGTGSFTSLGVWREVIFQHRRPGIGRAPVLTYSQMVCMTAMAGP